MNFYEITKVHDYKDAQKQGTYMMIEMRHIKSGEWFRTFICPSYRNFRRWRKIARVGNTIWFQTLKMKTGELIDADSRPIIHEGRRVIKQTEDQTTEELFKLGYLS